MTKEQVIETYLMNSPRVVAEMLYDTIERYEEQIKELDRRSCEECRFAEEDGDIFCTAFSIYSEFDYCSYFKKKG